MEKRRKITPNSAVVAPEQWGGEAKIRPYLDKISRKITDAKGKNCKLKGITDVIGAKEEDLPDEAKKTGEKLRP